jgi:predicted GIY-YIG superfamily endonuclease
MHYVYVIKSINDKIIYTGCTKDLRKRFCEHNVAMSRLQKDADLLSLYVMRRL